MLVVLRLETTSAAENVDLTEPFFDDLRHGDNIGSPPWHEEEFKRSQREAGKSKISFLTGLGSKGISCLGMNQHLLPWRRWN
jgi:hypothetical protein